MTALTKRIKKQLMGFIIASERAHVKRSLAQQGARF